ncbi:hypothetical protein ACLMJK_006970 [Lecanora helva]
MDSIPDQFLFINKTAKSGSLSHSKSKEKADIYSYVHSKYHKDRKAPVGQSKLEACTALASCAIISSTIVPKKTACGKSSARHRESNRVKKIIAKDMNLGLYSHLNDHAMDPFFCSSVTIDAKDQHLLYYPFKCFLETTFRAESFSDSALIGAFRHKEAVTRRLRRCVIDDLTMYTTLAYCASCMRWTVGEDDPERPAELYVVKAIEALRTRLENAQVVDSWLILSIYALAVSEMWAQNFDAAAAHLKMVLHFAIQLGGIFKLDSYLMESILLCDKYVAIGRFEPQVLPLSWEPTPLPNTKMIEIQTCTKPILGGLGQGFIGIAKDVLGDNLKLIVNDTVTCIQAAEYAKTKSLNTSDDQRWLFLRHQALVSRLLSLHCETHAQACTRIALLVWLLKITAYFGAQRWAKKLLPKLKAATLQLSSSGEWVPSSLIFWMTCLGAMTAEYTEERDWFLERTLKIARSLDVPIEKEAFRQILQRYFFINSEDGLQFFRMVRAVREMESGAESDC